MSKPRGDNRSALPDEPMSDEAITAFSSLGRQLASQMAEENFRSITSAPGWTMSQVEIETERALGRMEITSRDMLASKRADPDDELWREIWTVMDAQYRETMANLLRASGLRVGEKLQ